MNLDPSEEQRLLAASIERFVERDYAFETRRRIVASPDGYSQDVWRTMAELGLLGLPLPAAHGGFGGGAMDTVSLMEAIGGALKIHSKPGAGTRLEISVPLDVLPSAESASV